MANSVDPDETARYEPPHLELRSLQGWKGYGWLAHLQDSEVLAAGTDQLDVYDLIYIDVYKIGGRVTGIFFSRLQTNRTRVHVYCVWRKEKKILQYFKAASIFEWAHAEKDLIFFFFFFFFFFFVVAARRKGPYAFFFFFFFFFFVCGSSNGMCSDLFGLQTCIFAWSYLESFITYLWTAKTLVGLSLCAGSPEPLLIALVISTLISCASSVILLSVITTFSYCQFLWGLLSRCNCTAWMKIFRRQDTMAEFLLLLQGRQLLWLPICFAAHEGPSKQGSTLKVMNIRSHGWQNIFFQNT